MPRSPRIVIPGAAHHATQRGNNQQDVFRDEEDRLKYLDLLRHYGTECHLRIVAYCLMTNHVHLVAVPGFEESLADAIGRTHQQYTNYFHAKHGRNGHLFQSRFYSCPMDIPHTVNAVAYVEFNPVRAGMVESPWEYRWSSAAAHVGNSGNRLLDLSRWFQEFTVTGWTEVLGGQVTETDMAKTVRRHTRKGRPLGDDPQFLDQLVQWHAKNGRA